MPSKKKSAPAPSRARHSHQTKRRKPARANLLVIECDSQNLAVDGLDLGTPFGRLVSGLFPDKQIAVVQTSSETKLKEDLAGVFEKYGRFRSILLVGHSNETGLSLTSDGPRSWGVVGNWLQAFEPEFCFLAACRAGKSEAVRELFRPISTLRQIFASPAVLYKNQLPPIAVLIGMLLKDGKIDEDQSGALRLANYVLTGGQLYRWKRAETGPGKEIKARLLDGVASILDRGTWDLLEGLFPGNRSPSYV